MGSLTAKAAHQQTKVRLNQILADRKEVQERDRAIRQIWVEQRLEEVVSNILDHIQSRVGAGEFDALVNIPQGQNDLYEAAMVRIEALGYKVKRNYSLSNRLQIDWRSAGA